MTSHDLLRHVDPAGEAEALGEPGWFVRDGFLGEALALAVVAQASSVALRQGTVRRSKTLDAQVRSDEIAFLEPGATEGALREAARAFEQLREWVNQEAYLGLRSFDLQLARYRPGAHYSRHLDAFPGSDNRRLTAIVYLNPAWQPSHGGRLVLHVDPGPVFIEPTLDRLVVFRSELIEHEVERAHADRLALTAWFSATG